MPKQAEAVAEQAQVSHADPARSSQDNAPASSARSILGLQRAAGNRTVSQALSGRAFDAPPLVQQALRAPGQPLDPATRAFMEARFAHDFSQVRVHADERAAESAAAINASAFTIGSDVVFSAGRYAPDGHDGRRLLAHELAHVVQQERGGITPRIDPGAMHERDAAHAADSLAGGAMSIPVAGATGVGIAREEEKKEGMLAWAWRHRGQLASAGAAGIQSFVENRDKPISARLAVAAQTSVDKVETLIPPNELQPVAPVLEQAKQVTNAAVAVTKTPAPAAKPAQASKPPPSKPTTTLSALAAAAKAKGKEWLRDNAMEKLGTVKGVAIEASGIVDTVLWVGTLGHDAGEFGVTTSLAAARKMGLDVPDDKKALDFYNTYLSSYKSAHDIAKKYGFVDEQTGDISVTGVVAQGYDAAADLLEQEAFDDVPKEQALVFTQYELGELEGAVGTQVALAFTGVEEVEVGLKIVGAIGGAKGIVDSIKRNPQNWQKDPDFWGSILGLVMSIIGLKGTKASGKIIKIALSTGAVLNAVPPTWKLYNDYTDPKLEADPEKRRATIAQDWGSLIKVLKDVVIGIIHQGQGGVKKSTGGEGPPEGTTTTGAKSTGGGPVDEPVTHPGAAKNVNLEGQGQTGTKDVSSAQGGGQAAPLPVAVASDQPKVTSGPDKGLAGRGYTPGPGERTLTKEQWQAQQRQQRIQDRPGLENRGYKPKPGERTMTADDWKAQQRQQRIAASKAGEVVTDTPPEGKGAPPASIQSAARSRVESLMQSAREGNIAHTPDSLAKARQDFQIGLERSGYPPEQQAQLRNQFEELLSPQPEPARQKVAVGQTFAPDVVGADPNAAVTPGATTGAGRGGLRLVPGTGGGEPSGATPPPVSASRRPPGFEPTQRKPGRDVRPGTLTDLEPTLTKPSGRPRGRQVTSEEQLFGIPSAEEWERTRGGTPTRAQQAWAQKQLPVGSVDPAFPSRKVTGPAQADHIVSVDRIRKMPGFAALTPEQQLQVLNMPDNFTALSPTANASKGGKSFSDWAYHEELGLHVDEGFRQQMIAREQALIPMIQDRINALLTGAP